MRPLAYISKALSYKNLGLPLYEKELLYRSGKDNTMAYVLSRREEYMAITQVLLTWIQEVTESYQQDDFVKSKVSELLLVSDCTYNWSYMDGLLKYQSRLYVSRYGRIRRKLIEALHPSQLGGHSGIQASYMRASQLFYWLGMLRDFKEVILNCDTCKRCKDEHVP
ncbi:hypothetical protein ACH5RR_021031 [Cinchona calisaya]|uniref:Integrase zinc-binding domain-containing protein n=1 Tax=Cinchona calisaya TaxID=153742 RepID=A0ABD2ZG53_9GENT